MEILNKKQKIILIIIVAFIVLFITYYIINKANNSKYINLETEEFQEQEENEDNKLINNDNIELKSEGKKVDEKMVIHVTGAVKKPGIVKVDNNSRIADVIEEAGGTTENADLSKINLAYMVEDGQKIYVPSIEDKEDVKTIENDAGERIVEKSKDTNSATKININTASQTELETLNGIGTSTALKIINYRNENGNFKNIEDIKNVPGIGDSKFENIKAYICIK